jgi:hypothetical protein
LLVVLGSDQSGSDARVEANLLVDGTGIRLEGTSMPSFGLAEDLADQAVQKIDRLVGQAGGEIQSDGHQRRMPALPLETGDMLNGGLVSLARELAQACLVDQMSAAGVDADRTNMFQAFNYAEHGGWLGGLWHLPQPGQPDLAGFVPAFGQSVEPFSLHLMARRSNAFCWIDVGLVSTVSG